MTTYILLSLGAFIASITSHTIASLTRKHKYVVNGFVAGKASAVEKGGNEYKPKVFIPNALARWPWPRCINPHDGTVTKESSAWIESFAAFSPKAQHAFNHCNISYLASLTCPIAKKDHFRACCDFMNFTFFIDEHSDASEPSEVRKQKDVIMDALHNPHKPRPEGEWIGGEVTRQFWELTIRNASKQSQKRFIATFEEYLEAVVQQAIDRSGYHIRDIKSYINIRRDTLALKPGYALLELGLNIPDEVMSHHAIQEMTMASIDMIGINNDIVSYNVEQSRGDDGHNIITIVMNELDTDVNGAMLWAQDFHTKLEEKFLAAMVTLPEWDEPLNSEVREYCNGLGQWVRGYDDWQFESKRYLGNRGPEIKEKRWMSLMPKKPKSDTREIGPVVVDGSLL